VPRHELPATGKPPDSAPLQKIAVEEHFSVLNDSHLQSMVRSMDYSGGWMDLITARLPEFESERIDAMDAAGVTMSILSHTVPGVQGIADPDTAATAAREVNDFIADVVSRRPDRLAAFASVSVLNAAKGALELERAVTRLGLKGVMINGFTDTQDGRGLYLDDERCLPFWEAAAALQAPVYLHPRPPIDQRAYDGHRELLGAAWGFAPETATHALRIVYSGVLDRFPTLTVVLGHLGETLPYFAWRIQHCFEYNPSDKRVRRKLQDYLADNFYVTTSGHFSDQALISAILTIGADRILFAADYPYEVMEEAARWIERAPISERDRRKIAAGNARELFQVMSR
jgi:2,3-dihydroxybenzoate decarboxylase